MFTLVDVIHLIQYYYLTATGYDNAALEVEQVDLSALRGASRAFRYFNLIITR
jgi:5'-AMP-activated protein kinase regulatory gamma subunit